MKWKTGNDRGLDDEFNPIANHFYLTFTSFWQPGYKYEDVGRVKSRRFFA